MTDGSSIRGLWAIHRATPDKIRATESGVPGHLPDHELSVTAVWGGKAPTPEYKSARTLGTVIQLIIFMEAILDERISVPITTWPYIFVLHSFIVVT